MKTKKLKKKIKYHKSKVKSYTKQLKEKKQTARIGFIWFD